MWYIEIIADATGIGISEAKLDDSVLTSKIQTDKYGILYRDRNRHGGGVACYIRNDLIYNIKSNFLGTQITY